MGNVSCCEVTADIETFKTYCLKHCSPEYKTYLMEVNDVAVPSWEKPSSDAQQHIAGDWKEEEPQSGKGIIYSPDLFYYEGDILNGKATGYGKIIWPSHCIYTGAVLENKASGQGRLTFSDDNISLEGEWEAGLPKNHQPMPLLNNGQKA